MIVLQYWLNSPGLELRTARCTAGVQAWTCLVDNARFFHVSNLHGHYHQLEIRQLLPLSVSIRLVEVGS